MLEDRFIGFTTENHETDDWSFIDRESMEKERS